MRYSVDIDRSVDALTSCLTKVNNYIYDICDWEISINSGGLNLGIYLNFDLENKVLEISNQPQDGYDDNLYLEDIIDLINGEDDEDIETVGGE